MGSESARTHIAAGRLGRLGRMGIAAFGTLRVVANSNPCAMDLEPTGLGFGLLGCAERAGVDVAFTTVTSQKAGSSRS